VLPVLSAARFLLLLAEGGRDEEPPSWMRPRVAARGSPCPGEMVVACTLTAAAGRLGVAVAVEADEGGVVKRGGCGDEVGEYGSRSDKSTGRFPFVGMVFYSSRLERVRRQSSSGGARRGRVGMTSRASDARDFESKGQSDQERLDLSTLESLAVLLCSV
jgi:hypothetical protein